MYLYLTEDLVKAVPPGGGSGGGASTPQLPKPGGGPGLPKVGGDTPEGMQKCSAGGGDACLQAGGNGAEYHKVGGSIEQKHAEFRASQGTGQSPASEAGKPDQVSPEEARDKIRESAPWTSAVSPKETRGATSVDPKDYPEDSKPLDHYKVAQSILLQGKGSDSAKEIAEGHRNIARQRAEKLSPDEHEELAGHLHSHGLVRDAMHHSKQAKEGKQRQKESDELLATVEQMGQDVEARAQKKEKEKQRVGDEAIALAGKVESKKKEMDEDPYKEALEQHNDQKAKIDQDHANAMSEHASISRERRAWEKQLKKIQKDIHKHKAKVPSKFTDPRPNRADFEEGEAFSAAVDKWQEKKDAARDAKDAHQKELDRFKKEESKHRANEADKPGSVPKHPGYPEEPKEEDFRLEVPEDEEAAGAEEAPALPQSALDRARVASHATSARGTLDNIQSHLDAIDRMDISDDEKSSLRSKLEPLREALSTHADQVHVPSKEQSNELKELIKLAGAHGKKPFEDPAEEGEEAVSQAGAKSKEGKPDNTGRKRRKGSLRSAFESGRRFGTALGRAAATARGAGDIVPTVVNYGSSGVVAAGSHLFERPRRNRPPQRESAKPEQQSSRDLQAAPARREMTLGEEAGRQRESAGRQRESAARKSMSDMLYLEEDASLELLKAVQVPNTGITTPTDKQAQRRLKTSYAEQPVGVMGGAGIAMYDDPDVGRKWRHSPDDAIDADEDDEDQEENADVNKAMLVDDSLSAPIEGIKILSSLNKSLFSELEAVRYNPTEVEFMTTIMGVSTTDIRKGLVSITGYNRHRFHEWLLDRMNTTLGVSLG